MTVAVPLTETPPTIDGELSDGEWDGATRLGGFRCLTPDHGKPTTLDTIVHLIGGEGHLYVAFECQIEDPAKLRVSETREDARLQGQDRVSIMLDTLHDHRRQIELSVTARGTKYDARWGNNEWDAIWDVAAAIYDQSYVVEIGIDLASLTYERGAEQTIGANFARYVQAPDEDTAWAVDERTTAWNWQPVKFPHIAGLALPEKPAKQEIKIDAFAVAIHDFESDGDGFETNQGLDIEYPLSTNFTSRFVLFPDYSDVEGVYETIDVSYREQFLPETRDFFTHQAEFFGDASLFHPRRIENFDYGAKITGAHGGFRIGALNTYNPSTSRNDLVTHVTRELGQHTDSSLSVVDVRQPDFDNTALAARVKTRFEEDSPWELEGGHARSWSSDPLREGSRTDGRLGYNSRLFGAGLRYDEVSPNFDPIDGFNPRRGFGRIDLNSWKVWEQPAGKRFYDNFELFGGFSYGWTSDGRFYNRGYNGGSIVWFTTRSRIGLIHRREVHLEDHIRPQPFDDSTTMLMGEIGRETDLYARGEYTFGRVEDSRLKQFRLKADWRNGSGDLRAGVNYSWRHQDFFSGGEERAEIIDLNLTHVLNPEHWLSLRWFTRSGDADIDNLSLVYRIHKESGKELFVVAGDPQADQTRSKIAVKYVHPISF